MYSLYKKWGILIITIIFYGSVPCYGADSNDSETYIPLLNTLSDSSQQLNSEDPNQEIQPSSAVTPVNSSRCLRRTFASAIYIGLTAGLVAWNLYFAYQGFDRYLAAYEITHVYSPACTPCQRIVDATHFNGSGSSLSLRNDYWAPSQETTPCNVDLDSVALGLNNFHQDGFVIPSNETNPYLTYQMRHAPDMIRGILYQCNRILQGENAVTGNSTMFVLMNTTVLVSLVMWSFLFC